MDNKIVSVGYGNVKKVIIGGSNPLAYVGGPCAIESRDHALFMAEKISKICDKLEIPWVYKSCYDKDCRSSPNSFHGVGIDEGLKILSEVRDLFGVPVVSDFSDPSWAAATGEVCDMVQVPAYLMSSNFNTKGCGRNQKTCPFEKRSVYESMEYEKFY